MGKGVKSIDRAAKATGQATRPMGKGMSKDVSPKKEKALLS